MKYKRMPIEIESPEGLGYDKIKYNLSESSFSDQRLADLGINLDAMILQYGDHRGNPGLRECIAMENGVSAEHVLITPGAAAAIFIVLSSMLEKNDHLVVMKPNYATNLETPRAIGANISCLELRFENQYNLDLEELAGLIRLDTKLVSLTYPHNPTGVLISARQLHDTIRLIEKKNLYLVSDETYRKMSFVEPLPSAAKLSNRGISISSLSKSFGMPGIRIGWIITRNDELMEKFLAAKEQILITNSVVDEEIARQFLVTIDKRWPSIRQKITDNFAIVKEFMNSQNELEWVEPSGGCVCFPRLKKTDGFSAADFHRHLLGKYGTYLGRGHWFEEGNEHFRIGFGWEKPENLKKGLNNILLAIRDQRPG